MAKKNSLIISVNPNPICIAAEVDIARNARVTEIISGINLNAIVNNIHICETARDRLYEFIDNKYTRFLAPELDGVNFTNKIDLNHFILPDIPEKIDQLRRYKIDGVSIGLAALSSAASFAKCISEDARDYGSILSRCWTVAHKSYYAGVALSALKFDIVYIFNGRHAISRPIAEVMQKNCNVRYYEFNSNESGYLFFDEKIHSLKTQMTLIDSHNFDYRLGVEFFIKNISRAADAYSFRFSGQQEVGLLPELECDKDIMVFFTSSPDEYFSVSDMECLSEDFENQFHVAFFAAKECNKYNKQLIIRLHPHLQEKHISWMRQWNFELLESYGAKIIFPSEKYDSYALLKIATGVITCGSTIGIEAAYQGVPTGDASQFINSAIGCAVDVSSKSSLAKFVSNPVCLANGKNAAIKYGSYVSTTTGKGIPGLVKYDEIYRYEGKILSPSHYLVSKVRGLFDWVKRT
jgi:hypothetical protein